jgi:hypothetical protein
MVGSINTALGARSARERKVGEEHLSTSMIQKRRLRAWHVRQLVTRPERVALKWRHKEARMIELLVGGTLLMQVLIIWVSSLNVLPDKVVLFVGGSLVGLLNMPFLEWFSGSINISVRAGHQPAFVSDLKRWSSNILELFQYGFIDKAVYGFFINGTVPVILNANGVNNAIVVGMSVDLCAFLWAFIGNTLITYAMGNAGRNETMQATAYQQSNTLAHQLADVHTTLASAKTESEVNACLQALGLLAEQISVQVKGIEAAQWFGSWKLWARGNRLRIEQLQTLVGEFAGCLEMIVQRKELCTRCDDQLVALLVTSRGWMDVPILLPVDKLINCAVSLLIAGQEDIRMKVLEVLGELSGYWVEHMVGQVASQKPDVLRRVRSMLEGYELVIRCVRKTPAAAMLVNHLVAVCSEIAQYYHIPQEWRTVVDEMDDLTVQVRAMPRIVNDAPVAATGPEQRVQSVISEERTAFEETQVLRVPLVNTRRSMMS